MVRPSFSFSPLNLTPSHYYLPTNETTAVHFGQNDLTVTFRRYKRITNIIDGGFEGFICPKGEDICFADGSKDWNGCSPKGGVQDIILFSDFLELAIFGPSVGNYIQE